MTNTFVRDVKHERASTQSKISKTFLGRSINFYPSFYSVCCYIRILASLWMYKCSREYDLVIQ